jgi:8-oxo-dGTP diphosphatase
MPKSDQGVTTDRYQMIPRSLIFITRGDKILLLKGSPNKRIWANRYNGIGGHIERSETILMGAKRELLEETGLVLENLWLCGTVAVDAGEIGILLFVFRGECPDDARISSSHEGSLEWANIQSVNNLPLVEDLPFLLPRVMKKKMGSPPFFARSYYDTNEKLCLVFDE